MSFCPSVCSLVPHLSQINHFAKHRYPGESDIGTINRGIGYLSIYNVMATFLTWTILWANIE